MESVRFGIIGIGNMGKGHSSSLFDGKVPNATLAAVCDNNPEKLAWATEKFGDKVKQFNSAEEMFASKSIDAVLVATPHYDHPPLAIKALDNGIHTLIEKPAGVYTKQVRELNAFADTKKDLVFGIMFNQRTNGYYQKMRDLLQSGEAGELMRFNWIITDWYRTQAYYNSGGWRATWAGEGGGVLINQCPHNLDLWQWITGMPKRVRAFCRFGRYHNIEVEDDVTAYVEYENGASGLFITTTGEYPGTNRLEISCNRGKIVLEKNCLKFYRTRELVRENCMNTPVGFASPEVWECDIKAERGEEHVGILKNFTNAILKGEKLLAPGCEGINGLSLSNAMMLSTWRNDWVELPIDENAFLEELDKRRNK